MSTNDRNQRTIKTIGFTHCPPLAGMETVNNILTTALNALTKGNIELAEKDFTRAVSACLHEFGETDIVTARTLAHLARVCSLRGRMEVAAPMYERILRIHEALPAPSSCDHAVALRELAVLRDRAGMPSDAHTLRRRADGIMLGVPVPAAPSAKGGATETAGDGAGGERSDTTSESEDGDQEESDSGDDHGASDGGGGG